MLFCGHRWLADRSQESAWGRGGTRHRNSSDSTKYQLHGFRDIPIPPKRVPSLGEHHRVSSSKRIIGHLGGPKGPTIILSGGFHCQNKNKKKQKTQTKTQQKHNKKQLPWFTMESTARFGGKA